MTAATKVERFGWTFAPGDKVMQIENDYYKEVLQRRHRLVHSGEMRGQVQALWR